MSTFTMEWLQNTITSIESARDEIPFGLDEDQAHMLTAFKIALASLEAEPVSQTYKLTFEQWLEQQHDKIIGVDCGCVSTETLMHWIRVAYEAGNSPVTPDGWISCSERMPNEEDVLVYCSDTKEQMVGFHKGKGLFQFFYMNGVEGVCEPSHWMPLPEPPQEVS